MADFFVRYQIDVPVESQEDVELERDSNIGVRTALDMGSFNSWIVNADGEDIQEVPRADG